jgi:hypothetical protein
MSSKEKFRAAGAIVERIAPAELVSRIRLVPFGEIILGRTIRYLVKGIIPRVGLVIVWGPPKCGKSFWVFDLVMHVALGWQYRGRRVQQGPIVYCAFEGQSGFEARKEAFCIQHSIDDAPFYLEPVTLDLVANHKELIAVIRQQLSGQTPVAIVLDTLNRSLRGSESSDEDMSAYVKAADAIREAFDCAVIIVHHCGVEGSRPRGHTSLTGAADAQLSVKCDGTKNIIVTVEYAKDGPEGEMIVSSLLTVEVGVDEEGDAITSCVIVPSNAEPARASPARLTPNQQTMLTILKSAGSNGMSVEDWNAKAREAGIGATRKATLVDVREALKAKGHICEGARGWIAR